MLPAELIDHIFSFLQEDTLALKACSKAHPLYSRLAERHLYTHIVSDSKVSNDILDNPHLLDYPSTLEIRSHLFTRSQPAISFISVIPQMSNLVSLKICDPCPFYKRNEFISMLRNCLQQSSFQELHLSHHIRFSFSVLDDAKNIKHLTLSHCYADENEPISSSPSSQLSLDTLIFSDYHNSYFHRWAVRWVTRLTSLELRQLSLDQNWTVFSELLIACSNSLTKLHLSMRVRSM